MRRMKTGVTTNARLLQEQFAAEGLKFNRRGRMGYRCLFVTLTYRPGETWAPDHIKQTLQACRKWHDRLGLKMRYVWVAELQERGVVHYHIIFWLRNGYTFPEFDTRGWWPYGMSNIKSAQKPVGYLVHYAKKAKDTAHEFPAGARIHGCGGLEVHARIEARWWRATKQAREYFGGVVMNIHKITGGWVHRPTGELWRTPWRVLKINGLLHLTKINLNEPEFIPCPF